MKVQGESWSRVVVVVELVIAILIGVAILPWLFGDDSVLAGYASATVRVGGWALLAVGLTIWIVILSVSAVRFLAEAFARVPRSRDHEVRSRPEILAGLFIATLDIIIVNAIVRLPISALLALSISPALSESIVGVIAVALFLIVLVRLHFVARPYVEGSTWSALDVVVATTSSESLTSTSFANATTQAAATKAPSNQVGSLADTVAATRLADSQAAAQTTRESYTDTPTQLDAGVGSSGLDATRPDTLGKD